MNRVRRVPPPSLRTAPAWLTPQLVGRVIALADTLCGEPQPAPAAAPRKPVKMPRVVPTIGAIVVVPEIVKERSTPTSSPAEVVSPDARSFASKRIEGGADAQFRFKVREERDLVARSAPKPSAPRPPRRAALEATPARPFPTVIVSAPATTRADRKPVPMGWVEKRMAQSEAALAYLRGRGFGLSRVLHFQTNEPTGRYHVSGYHGEFDRTQLLELAQSLGFQHG